MIPDRTQNEAQLCATLSADQRKKVLDRVLAAIQKRFYAPEKLNGDWHAAVVRHRPLIEAANTPTDLERKSAIYQIRRPRISAFPSGAHAGRQVVQL